MKLRKTPIASAVALALISMMVHAQQSDTKPANPAPQTEAPKPQNEAAKPAPAPQPAVVAQASATQPVVVAQGAAPVANPAQRQLRIQPAQFLHYLRQERRNHQASAGRGAQSGKNRL